MKACGGKATPAGNLHITLAFLGSVAKHRLESLELAAQEVQGSAFSLSLDQARYWGHNHIVHAAPSAIPPQLRELVHALEHSLARHRFHFDQRPEYKPHATLLRHAKWTDAPLPATPPVPWHVSDFALVQSVGGERGVEYHLLARYPLA